MTQDEKAIIIRILDGDEQAYAMLIDRYKEGLYRHCFRFVRDEDWAEDITQETFIKAYARLETYDSTYRFSTWLYKIATNMALQEIRKKRPLPLDDDMQLISTLADTDQMAKDNELHFAVNQLSDNHKMVVVMHYWEGKTYEQIAVVMNTTTGSVKGWMSRAKQELRRTLS
jgi:RNA polymerase sigma-70 factor, ECF subfamily